MTLELIRPAETESVTTETLLSTVSGLATDDPTRNAAVNEVVKRHEWLVRWVASRYSGRGEDHEVLRQEAYVGLMEAISRFDAERGAFLPFAKLTVLGTVKRHFRDRRRWIRLPRRLQELQSDIRKVREEMAQGTGHQPTPREIAARMGAGEREVAEADAATFRPVSLDAPAPNDPDTTLADLVGGEDEGIDQVVDIEALRWALPRLPIRERKILLLRFYGNFTQAQIAEKLGISQMHVSRLIASTCAELRDQVMESAAS
ncbi:MAG TPA: sigma-70 family RNA polymerase sigma factor [Streptosporangiaceae bacterium]|jgi:RNA polymerase sigma-B factor